MKILVTGAGGFIGRNLCTALKNIRDGKDKTRSVAVDCVYEYDIDTDPTLLDVYCSDCDFVFNLAGVNRPKDQSEFMTGNFGFADTLLGTLKKHGNTCPVMISSSIQAVLDNPYGISKRAGENLMLDYGQQSGAKILVYRFPNVFGMGCRPNYNSAVATFCNNIANDLEITVNNRDTELTLVYVGDIVNELIEALCGQEHKNDDGFCFVEPTYKVTLGRITDLLYSFRASRTAFGPGKLSVADMSDEFEKKLYATYTSYLPEDGFAYDLDMHCDERGSFTEILRTARNGQFSVNISNPGITKGYHYHSYGKVEKFLVVSGNGLVRFRKPDSDNVIEYYVSSDKLQVVDIPLGYTHEITNLSDTEKLVTFMWCNECFDPDKPDTFFLKV